ncbi:unnamed protein product [Microthlaspi erraticum]|uniref:Uncharacterized protein n=1 Tax=Microthlaspi erraticum TaxID=1685480 RepID=A0A6D2IRC5_9BRAS|nr:unnamed protein product [Microthlaspi erraticum]
MADGFCRGRAIWSAKFVLAERISAEAERCFPDRPARSVRSDTKISADRGLFPGSCVSRERFLSRKIGRFPSRLDRVGQMELLGQNSLRVRGQCFGADCVFTPFSPSILS